jgi:hypothetical protein
VTTQLKDWVEAQRQIGDTLRGDIAALEARLLEPSQGCWQPSQAAGNRVKAAGNRVALPESLASQAGMGEELGAHPGASSLETIRRGGQRKDLQDRTGRYAGHSTLPETRSQSQEDATGVPCPLSDSVALAAPEHTPEFDYSGFEERFPWE